MNSALDVKSENEESDCSILNKLVTKAHKR
jgi:hypothetical protein